MNPYKLQIQDTFVVKNEIKHYDFEKCLTYIMQRGKAMYNPQFIINAYHKDVYFKLLLYAINDEEQLIKNQLSIQKGILLLGNTGLGKTAMMHLTKPFYTAKRQYQIKDCKALLNEFSSKGIKALEPLLQPDAPPLCLDQVGKEPIAKHLGISYDLVPLLVTHYYEQRYSNPSLKLHLITHLSPAELEKRYGVGFRKMLKELFHVIVCS